jgi:hypothetical protein
MSLIKFIFNWFYVKAYTIMIYIGLMLRNVEFDVLKANPDNLDESKKKNTRQIHHNKLLEKFYAGKRDEKYQKEYYELLRKADKFLLESTQRQMAISADKHNLNVDQKDQYGRRYDHLGFFYDGHRHAGKTIGEALEQEIMERRTNDDEYEILAIYNNQPIETGLSKIDGVVDEKLNIVDIINKSKTLEFPMKVERDVDVANKIEQLTSFLHVKKIGMEYRQLEFFIKKKFKLLEIEENSEIFNEIIKINSVFLKDKYGKLIGYAIDKYEKRIEFGDYVVLKFMGREMETITI